MSVFVQTVLLSLLVLGLSWRAFILFSFAFRFPSGLSSLCFSVSETEVHDDIEFYKPNVVDHNFIQALAKQEHKININEK